LCAGAEPDAVGLAALPEVLGDDRVGVFAMAGIWAVPVRFARPAVSGC
jgi:hypothetical protein